VPETTADPERDGELLGDHATAPAAGGAAGLLDALRGPRGAALAFGALAVAALPLILFRLGDHYWFFRDDWMFLTERDMTVHDLMAPHGGHWSTGLVVFFRVFWKLFGARFLPYQAAVVLMHLGVMVLVRQVMRRAGVGPWFATAVAGAGILYGSGREDILWAFQFGFTGSLMFGLLQLVLADHDGPIGRRDVLALVAGFLGMVTASPMLIVFPVTVVVVLVKRGWKPALVQAVPLGVAYLIWSAAEHPQRSPFGKPPTDVVVRWIRHGLTSNFRGLGVHEPVAIALALVTVVGVALALLWPLATSRAQGDRLRPADAGDTDAAGAVATGRRIVARGRARLAPVAGPVGLLVGSVLFMYLSAQARWFQGAIGAGASRYLYAYAALTLPAIGVAAQALAERVRLAGIVVVALLLVAVPANVRRFDDPPFGPQYFAHNEALLRNAVRMPFARQVPGDVRPLPDPFSGQELDMDFLLQAVDEGRLEPATGPMDPTIRNELEVRLSIGQRQPPGLPFGCTWIDGTTTLQARRGEQFLLTGPINVHLVRDGRPAPLGIPFRPTDGSELTIERGPLELLIESGDRTKPLHLCKVP
jgi:hypothetical protein